MIKILAVIPARGGSKGIPRKNVRLLNGKPLIWYSINNAKNSKYNLDVVITSDDEEIARIAEKFQTSFIQRPKDLAADNITLDPVIYHALVTFEQSQSKQYDYVITMQPTSPLLKTSTIDKAIDYILSNDVDTLISGVNKPHLSWTVQNGELVPNYEKRVNRQWLPKNIIETGAFLITKRSCVTSNNRIGKKVSIFETPENESIDIDSYHDWWIAERELNKKNILIRAEGYSKIGLGHVYRALLLSQNLNEHNVYLVTSKYSDLAITKFQESNFPFQIINDEKEIIHIIKDKNIDILINDILDTSKEYIEDCISTGVRVINFEDLGEGAKYAHAVINDLYEKKNDLKNHYWGSEYYCIRDEFIYSECSPFNEEVKEILVLFGGTDPNDLTKKTMKNILEMNLSNIKIKVVIGPGYQHKEDLEKMINHAENITLIHDVKVMSEIMNTADIGISSQGRTMYELCHMRVPTILLAQNSRELHHEFGYISNGFINLGLGVNVNDDTFKETLNWLIKTPQIRKQMRQQMEKSNFKNGIRKILRIILDEEDK